MNRILLSLVLFSINIFGSIVFAQRPPPPLPQNGQRTVNEIASFATWTVRVTTVNGSPYATVFRTPSTGAFPSGSGELVYLGNYRYTMTVEDRNGVYYKVVFQYILHESVFHMTIENPVGTAITNPENWGAV